MADRFDGYKNESCFEEARLEISMKAFLRKQSVKFLFLVTISYLWFS